MREVRSQDWPRFCEAVNRNERGGRLHVHKVELNGAKIEVAKNAAFDAIEFGRRDDCNDRIAIRMMGEKSTEHEILEPIRIQLAETENGAAFQSVVVEAEDGTTILTFHPTLRREWLSEIQLTE
jgi:hypothetical protein